MIDGTYPKYLKITASLFLNILSPNKQHTLYFFLFIMLNFFLFFCILIIGSFFVMILTINPIYSVLNLISIIVSLAIILFSLKFEFLPYLLLIVSIFSFSTF